MNIIERHVYSLGLCTNNPSIRFKVRLVENAGEAIRNGHCSFVKPMNKTCHKLYIIGFANRTVVYVGEAKISMSARLIRGLNPRGKHGYGYKWRDLRCPLRLAVWAFDSSTERNDLEAIEAEVALLVRLHSGRWPSHQNEIHFQNTARGDHWRVACKIMCEWDA